MFLDLDRKRVQKLFVGFVVLFIGIPFAFFGIEQYFQYTADTSVARVGEVPIQAEQLRQAVQQERQRLAQALGAKAGVDEAALKRRVLEGLIQRALLVQAAHDWGLAVDPVRVGRTIRSLPALQQDGRFDPERYRRLLAAQGLSVPEFEAGVREDLLVDQLRRGVAGTAFVADPELALWVRIQGERRELGYLLLPLERYLPQEPPSEQELKAWYEAHQDRFMRPEEVSIQYLELSVDQLAREEQVSEEELREYYREHAADYRTEEQRRARHLLIRVAPDAPAEEVAKARRKAEELLARIRRGEDFAALAKRYSQDPGSARQGGDLGFFGKGVMDPAFERAVFALRKPGEVAGPVRTPFGFHLIQLVEIRPGRVKPFAAVKERIAQALRREKASRRYYDLAEQLANLSFENPGSLEPAAEALGLKIQESGFFTRDRGEGIAADPKVRQAAFDPEVLEGGNNSEPIELGPDRVVVLRVKEHRPAAPRPFAEVRQQVLERLRRERAHEAARQAAQQAVKRLEAGEDPAAVAKALGGTWQRPPKPVDRAASEVPGPVLAAAFQAGRPQRGDGGDRPLYRIASLPERGEAVVAVYRVIPGDAGRLKPEQRRRLRQAMEQARQEAEFTAFRRSLEAAYPVERHLDRL